MKFLPTFGAQNIMKRALERYRNSAFGSYVIRNQKYAPILFFMGGFIYDTLTLGRIDRVYDTLVLCSHMTLLSITLYYFLLPTVSSSNISTVSKMAFLRGNIMKAVKFKAFYLRQV